MSSFQNARHMLFQGCTFLELHNGNATQRFGGKTSRGLQLLSNASLLNAIHDSSAREQALGSIPPKDRYDFLEHDLQAWARQEVNFSQHKPLALINGPSSNLAQIFAERMEGSLAATYCLSTPEYDDPTKFVPSIAYQLATKSPVFREILDEVLRHNEILLTKSLRVQLRGLIFDPIREFVTRGAEWDLGTIVIVDGFEQYKSHIQQSIISAVAEATHAGLPLRWAFFGQFDSKLERWETNRGSGAQDLLWIVHLDVVDPTSMDSNSPRVPGFVVEDKKSHMHHLFSKLWKTVARLWTKRHVY